MIHRQYVVKLAPIQGGEPNLDIVVSLPGSYAAPVGLQASYPAGPLLTAPPAGWAVAGTLNWYYEVRSRALRIPNPQSLGAAGYVPRLRLGSYLAIAPLCDSIGETPKPANLIPAVSLSYSLTPGPISAPGLGVEITDFVDPAYGPTIRIHNSDQFYGEGVASAYFLVSFGIAENKDEDWSGLGHA
jgi:hypothetical protein